MADGVSQAAWGSWAFPFWATAGLIATALLYLRGWRKIRRTRPHIFPPWRAWCFLGGLLALWIAIASPLDTLDGLLLTAHMTQHLILMSVVPPLLLLGAPAVPLLRGAATLGAARWPGPLLPHARPVPGGAPAHPSRVRMAGHEHRLPRLARTAGI